MYKDSYEVTNPYDGLTLRMVVSKLIGYSMFDTNKRNTHTQPYSTIGKPKRKNRRLKNRIASRSRATNRKRY